VFYFSRRGYDQKKEIASANSAITRPERRPIGELVEKTEKWEKEEVFIGQGQKKIEKRKKKKNSRHKNNNTILNSI
jgi:Rieske Fe-S protein